MENSGGAKDRSPEVTSNSLACMPAWVQTSWLSRRNEDADLTFDPLMDHNTENSHLVPLRGETWAMAQVPVASQTHDAEELTIPQTAPTRPTVSRWCA